MGSVEPEITVTPLPDGMVGVTGAWPWGAGGMYIRHGVRVPVGKMDDAKRQLNEWWEKRNAQAKTEAAS